MPGPIPDGCVARAIAIQVLQAMVPASGHSINVVGSDVTLVKDGIPEVYPLPEHVPRRMLHRWAEKYGVKIELFFHPEMCSGPPKLPQ
jgi:hypothetical protein